jgi:hypothetical protein
MGNIFKDSRVLNENEYNNFLLKYNILENEIPFRLKDKKEYKDIDIFTIDIPVNFKKDFTEIREINIRSKIQLPSDMTSNHILTHDNIQVDFLPFIGREYTRIFYSFEFANVFFKKMIPKANKNCKCTSFGIVVSNRHIDLSKYKHVLKFEKYSLVSDVLFLFDLLKLNIDTFYKGFNNRHELLDYFKTSEYYNLISFKYNSSFIRDINSLANLKLLDEENKLKIN